MSKDETRDDTLLEEARERFKAASEAESQYRADALDDLRFLSLDQWPEELKSHREKDPNGARPCLVLDKCSQHLRQIVNDMRQNRPAIKARPEDDRADKDTAEVFSGIIRHVEQRSGADMAYLTAGEHAASIGLGYFRILTEYEHEHAFAQEISIARIHNPFSVYFDNYSTELDGSDAEWCFVTDKLPKKMFERQFPDAEPVDIDHAGIGDYLDWYQEDSVRIAEYFYRVAKPETLLLLADGTTAWGDEYENSLKNGIEPIPVVQERQAQRRRVQWCKHTGAEILDRREFPSSYIPVIPVYGNQSWLEGERRIYGAVRAAKDPQRAYNYWYSVATELIALAPRAPFIGAAGQFEGFEDKWGNANTENYAYLEYNPLPIAGGAVPPPQRQAFAGVPAGIINLLQLAEHDIQAAFGQYDASLGAPSNEKSGVAIREKRMESSMGNSHYMGNLARSIEHAGYILVEMAPRVYDTKRTLRILGEDGTVDQAVIDPSIPLAVAKQRHAHDGKETTIFNLNVGRYDVAVTVGPGYSTRRQEAAEGMLQMASADPLMMQTAGDIVIRNQDWPGADAIADRRKRAIPPEIVGQEEGEGPDPAQLQAQMGQMQQQYEMQLSQAGEQMQQMQQSLADAEGKVADNENKAAELDLKRFDAQTKRLDLKIKAKESHARTEQVTAETAQTQGVNEVIAGLVQSAGALAQAAQAVRANAAGPKTIELVRDAQGRAAGAVVHSGGQ